MSARAVTSNGRIGLGRAAASALAVVGPGLVVMLADTDAGSIITAAQSGARWGFGILGLQLALVPVLYVVQELTVRLGLATGRGHGELIRERFGPFWAWVSVSALVVACTGALITEFSGIAGVGLLIGIPRAVSVMLAVALLSAVVWTGSYRSVERVALAIGLFEFAFFAAALLAHADPASVATGALAPAVTDSAFRYIAAANIGAVIMPWMIFYQQSAVVDKGLTAEHLPAARADTAIGAVITQLVMAAVVIATAATVGRSHPGAALDSVQQIALGVGPLLGGGGGIVLICAGIVGAALVASIVVSLTAAWGLGEVLGYARSLEHRPREAPWFYGVFSCALLVGAAAVLSGADLVRLAIDVEILNALLLPVVLGFLFAIGLSALPPQHRLGGPYAFAAGALMLATAAFGVFAAI